MKQSLICARLVRKTAFCPSEITTIFTEIWFNYISIPYTSSLISSLEFNFKAKKIRSSRMIWQSEKEKWNGSSLQV